MRKLLKRALIAAATVFAVAGIVLCIVYAVNPYKVRRLWWRLRTAPDVYVDRLKGCPYTKEGYDGIDVSKHNGVIKWNEVAKDERIRFVYIRATVGNGIVDRRYRQNVNGARKVGLKVGSYHFFTSKSSATAQFLYFRNVVKKEEQDLVPVLDVEEDGIKGKWQGTQLQDSVRAFAEMVKKHYGKYPIIYSNEHFYNTELGARFNRYFLFIANYQNTPYVDANGKNNIWQYSCSGHLHGIGERVDLSRFEKGTSLEDIKLLGEGCRLGR